MTGTQTAFLLGALTGASGTVVAGLLLGWPTGYLRERGRQRAADRHAHKSKKQDKKRAAVEAAARDVARSNAELATAREIDLLRRDRVGARFRWRAARDEVGMIGTVLRLDPRQPRQRVIVDFESPPDREPTEHDYDQPTSIEWYVLTKSDADQRHWTARLIENSFNDEDGWIQYERLPS